MKPQQGEKQMGLDIFAIKTKTPIGDVDFENPDDIELIARWRKHPNLHGWMQELYYERGGQERTFNCSPVRLDEYDLIDLEEAIDRQGLPVTEGFFFGKNRPEETEQDRPS
jgi:hypothetical protein